MLMEKIILSASEEQYVVFSLNITDVGGGPATLYIWNGGFLPPTPQIGDFLYDYQHHKFHIFHSNGWKNFSITDVTSRVWHPNGNLSVVSFTQGAIPYWMPGGNNLERVSVKFNTLYEILLEFKTFDAKKVRAERYSHSQKRNFGEIGREEANRVVERNPKPKRIREDAPLQEVMRNKDSSRFVTSSVGFPEDQERILWPAGFETYQPFAGNRCKEDLELSLVRELSRRVCLEKSPSELSGPRPDSFPVQDLLVELELDPILRDQGNHEYDEVECTWVKFISRIQSYMAQSVSVVIRGWTPSMRLRFSKTSLKLHFGNLGQPCEWIDGIRYATFRESQVDLVYHRTTTLDQFVDFIEDPNTCGNFLDAKDVNTSPPLWVKPLLDSTTAWNHTIHLKITAQKTKKKKGKSPTFQVGKVAETVLRSSTWTSQGWRLVTHPGFVTFPHHDCCGMATYVVGNCGAKIWGIIRPRRDICPSSLDNLDNIFSQAITQDDEGVFTDADVVTVCLEEGDIMIMPPGVLHSVYTPVPSVFCGGYFYNYETMHLTRAVLSLKPIEEEGSLTNDRRPGFLRTLCRMLIALRYRSEPREIGKKSLISLVILVIEHKELGKHNNGDSKEPMVLTQEERGELAFAVDSAQSILTWMDLTLEQAKEYVEGQGPYFSGGCERVEIPALRAEDSDPIFPPL